MRFQRRKIGDEPVFEVAPAFRPPGLGCWADSPDLAARRKEIARRYAWMAEQRRGRLSHDQKICLIRMRELERIYEARYGRCLPNDDAGRDDAEIMAHHIAHRQGEVSAHIRDWLRMWAPWMSGADVGGLIARVSARLRPKRGRPSKKEIRVQQVEV